LVIFEIKTKVLLNISTFLNIEKEFIPILTVTPRRLCSWFTYKWCIV
jgi:hypothetical protein